MAEDFSVCPVLAITQPGEGAWCLKQECAWWVPAAEHLGFPQIPGMCAIKRGVIDTMEYLPVSSGSYTDPDGTVHHT